MKIQLNEHYQSMTVRLIPGIHEVPNQLGKYLIDNGYAVAADGLAVQGNDGVVATIDITPDSNPEGSEPDQADLPEGDEEDTETDGAADDADYQAMTKGQLLNIATAGGLELSDRLSKQAIIDALIAHGEK